MQSGPIYFHFRSMMLATFPQGCVSRFGNAMRLKEWLSGGAYTVSRTTKADALLEASTVDLGEALLQDIEHLQNHCFEHLQELVACREDTRPRSSAWALVTAYYFSFFAALTFTRITGNAVLYGSVEASDQLKRLSGSPESIGLGSWTLSKVTDLSVTHANYQIVKVRKRFHEAVWQNALGSIHRSLKNKAVTTDPKEVLFYQLVASQSLFSRYINYEWPSIIRNLANYQAGVAYRLLLRDDVCDGLSLLDPWVNATDTSVVPVLRRLEGACASSTASLADDAKFMLAVGLSLFMIVRRLYADLLQRKEIDKRWELQRRKFRKAMLPETEQFEVFTRVF